jgi:hypothetical protein
MFAYFLEKLGQWFERAEYERRAEFLGQSADLADLERRMRYAERSGYPFCCTPRESAALQRSVLAQASPTARHKQSTPRGGGQPQAPAPGIARHGRRTSFGALLHRRNTMRTYQPNSPQAAARLIALAVLADGHVGSSELDALDEARLSHRLGLGPGEFRTIMRDLCEDLMATSHLNWAAPTRT